MGFFHTLLCGIEQFDIFLLSVGIIFDKYSFVLKVSHKTVKNGHKESFLNSYEFNKLSDFVYDFYLKMFRNVYIEQNRVVKIEGCFGNKWLELELKWTTFTLKLDQN